jgi:hypothetical protein
MDRQGYMDRQGNWVSLSPYKEEKDDDNDYNNDYETGDEYDDDYETDDDNDEGFTPPHPKEAAPRGLRCPAATVLVLDRCKWEEKDHDQNKYGYHSTNRDAIIDMVIHAPRLRRFTYKGLLRPFTFSRPPPELEHVDLHFFMDDHNYRHRNRAQNRDLATFWQFSQSFTSTKEMRLSVDHLEDIAVLREETQVAPADISPPGARRVSRSAQAQREDCGSGHREPASVLPRALCPPDQPHHRAP